MRCTINDIAIVTMGQSPKSEFYNSNGEGLPFLQGNRTFGRLYPTFDTYTTSPTKIAEAGDVIMSVRAPVGDLNITPVKMCLGRGVCSLRMKNGNQQFLYYLMKAIVPQLISKESGTVFGSVNRNDICSQEVDIPEDAEHQRVIARYLSAIDEKIETNHRINDNLQQQADAIFAELFLSGVDRSVLTVADVSIKVTDGVHNTVKDDPSGEYYLLSCKNIKGGLLSIGDSERRISKETFEKLRKRTRLEKGDILLSSVGTVGELLLLKEIPSNYEFQRSVAMIKPNPAFVSSEYLYQALRSKKNEIIHAAHGAVQQCLFISDISDFQIPVPTKSELEKFDSLVVPMFSKIQSNESENKRLVALRDILLPKLMAGEIDVSSVRI